jgi:hypothetical protein
VHIRVTVHGLLTAAVDDPDGHLVLSVSDGIELLALRSPLFDPRACLALVEGVQVPLDRPLRDGEHLHLYPVFGGG